MKRSLDGLMKMKSKTDERTASTAPSSTNNSAHGGGNSMSAKYLKQPVKPETAFGVFLTQARKAARNFLPKEVKLPVSREFCEIECRIGVLKAPFGVHAMRVTSSGPKQVAGGALAPAFKCDHIEPRCAMESGVSRTHFSHWTQAGLSEVSPISLAFGLKDVPSIKKDLVEKEYIETVYAGYPGDRRVCFPGLHPSPESGVVVVGKMEYKDKLVDPMDLAVPAASYDVRISLSAEKALDSNVKQEPPPGWTSKRIKRRRSYSRRDQSFAWQLDVTEVTTSAVNNNNHTDVTYEIELEILPALLLQLINEMDEQKAKSKAEQMGHQLWYMLQQINPLSDVSDVEEYLKNHSNTAAVGLALAQCAALKSFVDHQKSSPHTQFFSPIGSRDGSSNSHQKPTHFMGCMPVNFSRHNIEEIQRAPDNAYFCSEKTDGVRHLMVFTGDTVVLVDRALGGKQPKHSISNTNTKEDPMQPILSLIKPGTVFDGEVVMNRKFKRPIFIVFDVMCSGTQPVLHLPFQQRLQHLKGATFRTADAKRDMFDPKDVTNQQVALPLVRKNFVQRTELADMLSKVMEERGMRTYRNGDVHNHLTDGIIFQPNLPYVCGTDVNLLKWKYLDTVTIDVQLLPPRQQHNNNGGSDDEDVLRVGCLGEEGTLVDMTRHVHLPRSERLRLEADRAEAGGNIAEVGFDPETGEWYYLTMRSDKVAPNHISTVLGTLLELAESLTTEELIYRMSVPAGGRDSYRKDFRGMLKQLLDFQKKKMKTTSSSQAHR